MIGLYRKRQRVQALLLDEETMELAMNWLSASGWTGHYKDEVLYIAGPHMNAMVDLGQYLLKHEGNFGGRAAEEFEREYEPGC